MKCFPSGRKLVLPSSSHLGGTVFPGQAGLIQRIQTLNLFLRGEISAVETYRQALERLQGRDAEEELRACLASHERRVQGASDVVYNLPGRPLLDLPLGLLFVAGIVALIVRRDRSVWLILLAGASVATASRPITS